MNNTDKFVAAVSDMLQQASAASPRVALATINQIGDALTILCNNCKGSSEAALIEKVAPTILDALQVAITYRSTGTHQPSSYTGWWKTWAEIDDATKQAADNICQQIRPR